MSPKKPPLRSAPSVPALKRVFKTEWFTKAAAKRGITDTELCEVLKQVMLGQAVDLGGGIWKKRLNDNMDRSIIAAKGSVNWIYLFLFQKSDRENIDQAELAGFKRLAHDYAKATDAEITQLLRAKLLVEICNDGQS